MSLLHEFLRPGWREFLCVKINGGKIDTEKRERSWGLHSRRWSSNYWKHFASLFSPSPLHQPKPTAPNRGNAEDEWKRLPVGAFLETVLHPLLPPETTHRSTSQSWEFNDDDICPRSIVYNSFHTWLYLRKTKAFRNKQITGLHNFTSSHLYNTHQAFRFAYLYVLPFYVIYANLHLIQMVREGCFLNWCWVCFRKNFFLYNYFKFIKWHPTKVTLNHYFPIRVSACFVWYD